MNWYAFTPKRRRLSDSIIVYADSAEKAEKCARLDSAGSPYQMYLVDNAPTYSSSFIYLKKITIKKQK